ncbi:tRNA (adenosine(37)-N6)-threonylcarbamoyltransferase complex ATPase subunit type 1 TsaE [Lacticaseibacillus yichunensis]|uniref:tRNA threonylcarbamoyladenosine biosynthesis protein TsaE n=1 Tax=Lacticaseibacillus yichunensis TaxID=2486015 RepID=A0ABW4CQR0_9LACO|nr:tRNA (adenosine(37)-N6)-threonylcarbamoyltransferase complex ATPase subunit type 1 TsaE [Lacticaseibacillus yichunensis]
MTTTFANEAALQTFAAKIAPLLQAGDVLLLEGDLGAGKTSFTKGLAKGLGISQNVKSPTFTIIREYPSGRLPLYHMDIYRLEDGGVEDLGLEEYFDGDGVSVVEWPQFLGVAAPSDALTIRLDKEPLVDEQRLLTISATGPRATALAAQISALK